MADNKDDEFAEINKKIDDQNAELFTLIFAKFVSRLGLMSAGESNERLFDLKDGFLTPTTNESGKLNLLQDTCNLALEACKLYELFYKKAISLSKTWKKRPVMEKADFKIKYGDVTLPDDIEWSDQNYGEEMKKVAEEYNNFFSEIAKININDMCKKSNENCMNNMKILKGIFEKYGKSSILSSITSTAAAAIKDKDALVKNAKDVKWPDCVAVDGEAKEEDDEGEVEVPQDVEKAVNTVAKEVIAVNDKPEDPKTLDNFKKVAEDMKKTAEIVKKWTSDKNNKAMERRLGQMFQKISPSAVSEVIPQAWVYANMQKFKNAMGEAIVQKQLLNFLNESEEENSEDAAKKKEEMTKKVLEIVAAVDNILKKEKMNDFKNDYLKWCEMVKSAMEAALKNEKLAEKMKEVSKGNMPNDPYAKILLLATILSAKDDKESEESEESNGETAKQPPAGDSNPPAENASFNFAQHFQNYLQNALNE